MTEPNDQPTPTTPEPEPASTSSWGSSAAESRDASKAEGGVGSILESLRDAVDDLAERATPTVRELSAKAAELAAVAADKAAPIARKAGEVTADASGKLAEKSRGWATDLRSAVGTTDGTTGESHASDASASGTATPEPGPGPEASSPGS